MVSCQNYIKSIQGVRKISYFYHYATLYKMKNKFLLLFFLILLTLSCSRHEVIRELWYDKPAADWNEALPVGNGRLGSMVFGDTLRECIQINEESIWAGSGINNNNPEALANLPALRDAIFKGDIRKAEEIAGKYFLGTPPRIRSYQPLGNLLIDYEWNGSVSEYRRSLDIRSGIASTKFMVDGEPVTSNVFASAVDNVLVVEIKAGGTELINCSFELTREKDAIFRVSEDGRMFLTGQIIDEDDSLTGPGGKHMRFASEARFRVRKGSITAENSLLRITGASEITMILTAATDYNIDLLDTDPAIDPASVCAGILDRAGAKEYSGLLRDHTSEHRAMFDRVSLKLGPDTLDYLPVNKRIERVRAGSSDNGLIALYFDFGRYLLMGSSRYPAVLPANLQGIWNKDMKAPWNSDFHTNINLQMNYWPAEVCNLPETGEILARFVKRLTVPGAVTAREMYGTGGWTMHHLTDPFGRTGVADGVWGLTPTNGPWMTFTLYEHYLFTLDKEFLRETAYPVLKGSAEFLLGFLTPSPEGYLVTNPSTSPENRYFLPQTRETAQLTYSATIDIETVNAVFDYCVQAAEILDTDAGLINRIMEAKAKLPPLRINSNGTIQEWINDYEEVEPGHRHMSHLVGLYPLAQITPQTGELFEAAGRTIERRLASGGGHTGWSRAWIINFYARLLKGDKAYEHIMALLAKSTQFNLFDSHPPFQIDGNFGGTAGIAEMLLQSHQGLVELLPALPSAWSEGEVKGLVARGGFVVDIAWKDGNVISAKVHSNKGGTCRVKYGKKLVELETVEGEDYELEELI